MVRGIPWAYRQIKDRASGVKTAALLLPTWLKRCSIYCRDSPSVIGWILRRIPIRCLSCRKSSEFSLASSSGWPTSTTCSSLALLVSRLESMRSSSRTSLLRFWASSMRITRFSSWLRVGSRYTLIWRIMADLFASPGDRFSSVRISFRSCSKVIWVWQMKIALVFGSRTVMR